MRKRWPTQWQRKAKMRTCERGVGICTVVEGRGAPAGDDSKALADAAAEKDEEHQQGMSAMKLVKLELPYQCRPFSAISGAGAAMDAFMTNPHSGIDLFMGFKFKGQFYCHEIWLKLDE